MGNEDTVFVRLLDEGVNVFRPIISRRVGKDIYLLMHVKSPSYEDESLEFTVGATVKVERQLFEGKSVLVAVKLV